MQQPEKIFENFFDDENITTTNLCAFAVDTTARFRKADPNGVYKLQTDAITTANNVLLDELDGVDQNINRQKGKTKTVNEVTAEFKKDMSDLEGPIALAIGGFDKPVFLEIYPHGVSEYSTASLTGMPLLVDRVFTFATNNSANLGVTLTSRLQAFQKDWKDVRVAQQEAKGVVKTTRTDRTADRRAVELDLLSLIHQIASDNRGNVAACMQYFDFNLLGARGKGPGPKPPVVN